MIERKAPIRVWLAAFGLVLVSATQLRPSESPLGPGEMLLLLFCLWTGTLIVLKGDPKVERNALELLVVLLLAIAFMFLGDLTADARRLSNEQSSRDLIALMLAWVVVLCAGCSSRDPAAADTRASAIQFTKCILVAALVVFGGAGIALALGVIEGEHLLYGDRFAGLATNPNQVGLYVVALPFLAIHLWRHEPSSIWLVVVSAILIAVGLASHSDAVVVAWAASSGVAIAVFVRRRLVGSWRFGAFMLATALFVLVVNLLGDEVLPIPATELRSVIADLIEFNYMDQASIRFDLWTNGLLALQWSGGLGFGSGAYSGLDGPFQGHESHHTFIEWANYTGVLGLLVLVGYLVRLFFTTSSISNWALRGALLSLIIFSAFHIVVRHPIFWMLLLLISQLSPQRHRTRSASQRSRSLEKGDARVVSLHGRPSTA